MSISAAPITMCMIAMLIQEMGICLGFRRGIFGLWIRHGCETKARALHFYCPMEDKLVPVKKL